TQPVAAVLEVALDALEVVELAVRDDAQLPVLVRDRLVAGREVDDAEARVPQPDASMRRDPAALGVGPAVEEAARGAQEGLLGDRLAFGEHRDDAAHRGPPPRCVMSRCGAADNEAR